MARESDRLRAKSEPAADKMRQMRISFGECGMCLHAENRDSVCTKFWRAAHAAAQDKVVVLSHIISSRRLQLASVITMAINSLTRRPPITRAPLKLSS